MPVATNTISQPNAPERQPSGKPVSATITHSKYGRVFAVTGGTTETTPILIRGNSRISFYIEVATAADFDLEVAYNPIFDANGKLDIGLTGWAVIASASTPVGPPAGPYVLKQTLEDVAYAYRLVITTIAQNFTVYDWQIT